MPGTLISILGGVFLCYIFPPSRDRLGQQVSCPTLLPGSSLDSVLPFWVAGTVRKVTDLHDHSPNEQLIFPNNFHHCAGPQARRRYYHFSYTMSEFRGAVQANLTITLNHSRFGASVMLDQHRSYRCDPRRDGLVISLCLLKESYPDSCSSSPSCRVDFYHLGCIG